MDATGRVTGVTDAKGAASATTYTADAKVGSATNASGGMTTNTFGANAGESLTTSAGPTGATVTATYNAPGQPYLPDSVNDSMGNHSTFTYAGPGNLSATANAMAATARLSYNADGTVATATDPGGGVTTYAYNGAHQLVTVTAPAGTTLGAQRFTYDGSGRLKTAVSGKGMITTYSYDALDRPTGETHSDATATVSSGYDAAGNLTSRSDASGSTTFGYDVANHVTRKTLPGGAVLSYSYDAAGNLATATDASGTTTYRYDKVNRLDQVTEAGGRTDVFAYDADHRRTDTWGATNGPATYDASGNNIVAPTGFAIHIRSSFDTAGQLTQLKTTRASSNADAFRVADLSYAYTVPTGTTCAGASAGRATSLRQSVTDNLSGALTAYCYDGGARLTKAATGGGATYSYGYDANGNRSSGPEGTHSFNAANQATDASSAFDANGNLTASSAFPALGYNGVGQATSITAAGQPALALAYAGTANAERTAAGTTTFQTGLLGVQSQAAAGTTSNFVRDSQGGLVAERIGPDEYYYAFDGLGSVIALIDATGTQRAAYSYDPYGDHATATALNGALPANPWRYAGGALDSTGLYHFGARYYDPAIGRWTQQDSIVSLGDPGNANRYAYAADDPVNYTDANGLKRKKGSFSNVEVCALGGNLSGAVGAGVGAVSGTPFFGPAGTLSGALGGYVIGYAGGCATSVAQNFIRDII